MKMWLLPLCWLSVLSTCCFGDFKEDVDKSVKTAIAMYPDAGVRGSVLFNAVGTERSRLEKENASFFTDPDWPVMLVSKVAARLGVQPQQTRTSVEPSPSEALPSVGSSPSVAAPPSPRVGPSPPSQPAKGQKFWWYQVQTQVAAYTYDGTGDIIKFDAGNVFPVSRVLTRNDLDEAQQKELPPAQSYLVIPSAGYCIITPMVTGNWIDPYDQAVVGQVSIWTAFEREQAQRIAELPPQQTSSTQRYYARKAVRDARAAEAADRAIEMQRGQQLQEINRNLQDLRNKMNRR